MESKRKIVEGKDMKEKDRKLKEFIKKHSNTKTYKEPDKWEF